MSEVKRHADSLDHLSACGILLDRIQSQLETPDLRDLRICIQTAVTASKGLQSAATLVEDRFDSLAELLVSATFLTRWRNADD